MAHILSSSQDNYMKGTVGCNTTRDYIKTAVFFTNTAIVLSIFIVGIAGGNPKLRYANTLTLPYNNPNNISGTFTSHQVLDSQPNEYYCH